MMTRYDAPPYQPKWILQAQVFLLRHLKGSFSRQTMIINTTGRKTGHKHSVPIGFIQDGATYLALNLGGHSHWFLNALANPCVTLEIEGRKIEARAEKVTVNTPQELRVVLAAYERERPEMFSSFFGLSADSSSYELMRIGERVAFMRFVPQA